MNNTRNISDEYIAEVKKQMIFLVGDGYEIDARRISKNNSMTAAFTVRKNGLDFGPTGYLYKEDNAAVDAAILTEKLLPFTDEGSMDNFDVKKIKALFNDFDSLKDSIYAMVVALDNPYVKDKVHRPFFDLAIIPYVLLESGVVSITNRMLEYFNESGITADDVINIGIEHSAGGTIVKEILGLHALTTESLTFGAIAITDNRILDKLRENMGDYYLIPSSVHEFLAVPVTDGKTPEELHECCKDVNLTLSPEDVLGDTIYFYDGELKTA